MRLKFVFVMVISLSFSFLMGCEDEEASKISEAQACLNNIPSDIDAAETAAGLTNDEIWIQARDCANKVNGVNTQQANIIRCGAYLTGGGLDTRRILDAAKELNDEDESNSEAVYLAALTLNKPNDTSNVDLANDAKSACEASGIDAYAYIGSLAAAGTAVSKALEDATGTGFLDDFSNINDSTLDTAREDCIADADCVSSIASSADTIASTYCGSEDKEDDEVCNDIETAIADAGGDDAELTKILLCLLDGEAAGCEP